MQIEEFSFYLLELSLLGEMVYFGLLKSQPITCHLFLTLIFIQEKKLINTYYADVTNGRRELS